MSFICARCDIVTAEGEKGHRIVVEERVKVYPGGGIRLETVREILVCEKCAKENAVKESEE
jgi:hypothetical protein